MSEYEVVNTHKISIVFHTEREKDISKKSDISLLMEEDEYVLKDDYDHVLEAFDDPKIGFVYTDLKLNANGYTSIEYMSYDRLPNMSFFVRNVPDLCINKSNIEVMNWMLEKGYYFEHIAEPLIARNIHVDKTH